MIRTALEGSILYLLNTVLPDLEPGTDKYVLTIEHVASLTDILNNLNDTNDNRPIVFKDKKAFRQSLLSIFENQQRGWSSPAENEPRRSRK